MDKSYTMDKTYTIDKNNNNLLQNEKEKYSLDFTSIQSVVSYIINHYEKFLLLILVFVIIYIIEHISNINASLFGTTQPNIMGISSYFTQTPTKKIKKKKT